ncbi:MAG: hypothetical protein ACFCVA_03020 [Gammaproteobacteria bacterium]
MISALTLAVMPMDYGSVGDSEAERLRWDDSGAVGMLRPDYARVGGPLR